MPDDRPHFFDLTFEQLQKTLDEWGMPRFRAGQVCQWVYKRGVADPNAMTDLSASDRRLLAERMRFATLESIGRQLATDGTQKLLLRVPPRSAEAAPAETECVMIPAENPSGGVRRTACISSQVGCPVGCRFCASGLGGLESNLTAGQIVEQIWHLNQLPELGQTRRITNVVFMGMGEPLANFANVMQAVRTLSADWAFGLAARRITISTVGLPPAIRRLADQIELPVTLAISLHAPNDELRRRLIPWAEFTSVEELVAAAEYYFQKTGREVTIEYILLRDVNDRPEHARELANLTRRLRCHVNLIRYNEVRGLPFSRPASEAVYEFQRILRQAGVNVHVRASRGRDIAAACGQLRHERRAGGGDAGVVPLTVQRPGRD